MKRGLIASAAAILGLVVMLDGSVQGGKEPATIKVIMDKAHKGKDNLRSKVIAGKASDEEKKQLLDLYTDLAANKCPKGDADDWKTRTKAIVDAAKANDTKALAKATDCKGCHSTHK